MENKTEIDISKLEAIEVFPRWAYTDEEWTIIESETVYKQNGIRYKYPEPEIYNPISDMLNV